MTKSELTARLATETSVSRAGADIALTAVLSAIVDVGIPTKLPQANGIPESC